MHARLSSIALLLAGLTFSAHCAAAEPAQWWGVANIGSQHFGNERDYLDPGENFREFNPGLGIEAQWQPRHAVAAGYFRNSVDRDSFYALYQYTPLAFGEYVRFGGMAGVVTGYPGYNDGGLAPAGGLILKLEGERVGANLVFLPKIADYNPSTLGLQVKYKFR